MVKLIKGNWYQLNEWIFKFNFIDNSNNLIWNIIAATPHDNYKSRGGGNLHFNNIKDIKSITDFSDVYRLFPEEKIMNKNKIYELW
jgi:hypothetical protein